MRTYSDIEPDPYYDDEPEDECEHEDYDSDILTGRAFCNRCDFSWYLTEQEISAETERIRAYDEWQRQLERPWNRFKVWLLRWRLRRLRRPRPAIDDELPF